MPLGSVPSGIQLGVEVGNATTDLLIDGGAITLTGLGTTEGTITVQETESGDIVQIGSSLGLQVNGNPGTALELLNGAASAFKVTDRLVRIGINQAPADADLETGQASLWFDQTDGAAKLMIKAKQANGTVKTGSVNVVT